MSKNYKRCVMTWNVLWAVALCLASASLSTTSLLAQNYPDRPIRIVVPFAAGGGSDVVGRAIAQKLADKLGQSVVVENRTGAGGSLGAAQVARAQADGYTLLLASSSEIAQYPNVVTNVPYDPIRDFMPIALLATVPLVLTVSELLPVDTVQELLDHARRNPGKLNYGSAGPGSTTHLAMALFTSMTGTTMTHVPYRGSAPVVTDLLAGSLHLAIPTMAAVLPHAAGGKLKLLAVSTSKRAAALPNLPTIAESGVPGYATGLWTGLMAPANTPASIVAQLNAAVSEALASSDLGDTLARQGAEQAGGTPEQFAQEIKREMAVWREVVKQTGIRID
jgi:tripartite-type tricarboxylate transporter receptor subunit TctC